MIEPIKGKGVQRARVICDDCDKSEPVTCDYERQAHGDWVPNEGQVKKKIIAHGWTDIKGKLRCPTCEAKRKVVPMQAVKTTPQVETPREPTKKQRLEIISMLMEVYDLDAECYSGGETDDTVADALSVMPGWVSQVRDAEFGPSGGNEDIEALAESLEAFLVESNETAKAAQEAVTKMMEARRDAQGHLKKLNAIKKAVGARILKKAGVDT